MTNVQQDNIKSAESTFYSFHFVSSWLFFGSTAIYDTSFVVTFKKYISKVIACTEKEDSL